MLKDCDCLINLASKEYSKSVLKYIPKNVQVITCVFGEIIDGKIKEKGTYAKMARVCFPSYVMAEQSD
ncbi:MAG: peroxide stress protein YaaA [Anaerobutyricum sp.]